MADADEPASYNEASAHSEFIDPSEFRAPQRRRGHTGDSRVVRVSSSKRTGNVLGLTMHHYVRASAAVSVVEPLGFDIAMSTAHQFRAALGSAGLEMTPRD
jgi:hypothetical protein